MAQSPTSNPGELYIPLAEKSVIQAIMLDNDILPRIKSIIPDPIAFFSEYLREAYRIMLELESKGKPIDIISIKTSSYPYPLDRIAEVFEISSQIFPIKSTWEHVKNHAQAVQESYLRRELHKSAGSTDRLQDILILAEELTKKGEDRIFTTKDLGVQVFDSLDSPTQTMTYPFAMLNKATKGIGKGQFIVVAARPSVGKSTILDNIALHLAAQRKKIFFASAEMSAESISKRMISRLAKVNLFYEDHLTDEQSYRVSAAVEKYRELPIIFHEMYSISQLESQVKMNIGSIDIILVDYLQLLEPKKRYRSSYERATFASNELKEISRKFNVPLISAAQFNRSIEDDQPSLSNLKESGAIEQDADIVISLWKKSDEAGDIHRQKIYMDLLKNRNGFTYSNGYNEYYLWFDKTLFQFSDPELTQTP